MYLKAIELHGFKSFPDKTKIEFEKGMSVVVGPNGSGKSNISDAIRWVLGETRGSRLRAGAKMEDIIFGGTQKRPPMGFASVSLILDNSARTFDVDSDEIAVMRKYYRGGDSEYYINGARVRLKDIQELFFDTGLGKNGYSIVSQGKISEIVTARPEGRREFFEEACGIAKFRYKKNEAERRLENAGANITRLTDILTSLEERVGPLEKESRKAKEFLTLSERKKELEISLWMDTVDKSRELIRSRQRRMEIFTSDYEQVSGQLEESERRVEERYLHANRLLSMADENNRAIREAEGRISRLSSDKAVAVSRIGFADEKIKSLRRQLADFDREKGRFEDKKAALKEKIDRTDRQWQEKERRRQELHRQLERLAGKAREAGDEKGRLAARANEINLASQKNRIDMAAAASHNRSLRRNVANYEQNIADAGDYLEKTRRQAGEIEQFIQAAQENITKNSNIKNGLLMKKNSASARLEEAQKKRRDNLSAQRQARDRIRLLTELENNMDGFSQSVKTVLKKAGEGALRGILGSVSQIISVEKGYETAVEVALGYALQNVVVEDEGAAKRAIEYLKANRAGRATFLPLDTVRPSVFRESLPRWARTGDSVVKARDRYAPVISNLLGRIVIVPDIDSASSLAKKLAYRYKIVTADGQQINAGGSFTGGSLSRSAGLFTRKTEIENLTLRLQKLKEQRPELEKAAAKIADEQAALNARCEGCDAEVERLNKDISDARVELARLEQSARRYRRNIDAFSAEKDKAMRLIAENEDKNRKLEEQLKEYDRELARLKSKLEALGRMDEDSVRRQARISRDIQRIRLEAVSLKGRADIERNNLNLLENERQNKERSRRKTEADIDRRERENRARQASIRQMEREIDSLRRRISRKEEENRSFVAQRLEIEAERTQLNAANKDLSAKKEDLSGQIAKISERIASMETSYDRIIAKLWEEYELTVQTAREICRPITDEAAMKRELAGVRNSIKRLGSVNVGAIEEYREVSRRYSYLKDQLEDVLQSKNRLIKLITSLNGEMKALFTSSFREINENFGRIFAELFGGGSARLELVDKEDVLNSGIEITVNPPGKVIKSLNALSGGEQAMVALSIYFAILAHNPSPFCVLDEIEAALDDVNVTRYAGYLHRICDKTQFIVITHRRGTMEAADVLYGVTMQEDGISKLLRLDVNNLSPSILN